MRHKFPRLRIEPLESRNMLAGDIELNFIEPLIQPATTLPSDVPAEIDIFAPEDANDLTASSEAFDSESVDLAVEATIEDQNAPTPVQSVLPPAVPTVARVSDAFTPDTLTLDDLIQESESNISDFSVPATQLRRTGVDSIDPLASETSRLDGDSDIPEIESESESDVTRSDSDEAELVS